ncbi:MAG: hypothetical protein AAF035_09250, partial [Pseudomonadota bacterium]
MGAHDVKLNGPVGEKHSTTCYMCACRCGINVYLKPDESGVKKVRYIEGNRDHPVNKGVLCAKGSAGIMQHYSPARLSAPMKRVGPRGSGEFEEIDAADHHEQQHAQSHGDHGIMQLHQRHEPEDFLFGGAPRQFAFHDQRHARREQQRSHRRQRLLPRQPLRPQIAVALLLRFSQSSRQMLLFERMATRMLAHDKA